MKNLKFVVLVALLFNGMVLSAQTFGVRAGANFAKLKATDGNFSTTTDATFGLLFGGVVEFELAENIGLETGLLFVQTGGSYPEEDGKIIFSNLQIPLHGKYYFEVNENLKPFAYAGPYFGYALSGKEFYNGESETFDLDEEGYKSLDFGFNFGAGIQIKSNLQFAVGYSLGIADLEEEESIERFGNRGLQVTATYFFN